MHQIFDNITTIKIPRRRRRRGSYRSSIERRAATATIMIKDRGWGAKQAAALFCVNRAYLGLALHLTNDDLVKLARGELKLATLWQDHRRHLAERRAQRVAEERAAKVQAECEAQVRAVDDVLERVGVDCLVDRLVTRSGPQDLLEELDVALQRRGQDLAQLVVSVCRPDRLTAALDILTAPHRIAAE
jgi:hypothetical protein